MKCPKCEEELDCDEVDIGVGTMRGNYRCPACGWGESDIELPDTVSLARCIASTGYKSGCEQQLDRCLSDQIEKEVNDPAHYYIAPVKAYAYMKSLLSRIHNLENQVDFLERVVVKLEKLHGN